MSDREKRTEVIGVRMTPAERAELERYAANSGMTVAEYLRSKTRPQIAITSAATACYRWL